MKIRLLQRLRKDERGDILPFTVVMLIVILLVTGFAVDGSRYLTARRELSDVADQAALAAAQKIDKQEYRQGEMLLGREAEEAGHLYLADSGFDGEVTFREGKVEVEIVSMYEPVLFAGFSSKKIVGKGSSRPADGLNDS